MRIAIWGNCQTAPLADYLHKMIPDAQFNVAPLRGNATEFAGCDVLLVQTAFKNNFNASEYVDTKKTTILSIPTLYFDGFHPDVVIQDPPQHRVNSHIGIYNSGLALYGYTRNRTVNQTLKLYRAEVYERLGYNNHWQLWAERAVEDFEACGMDGKAMLDRWIASGRFFHTPNHPMASVILSVADGVVDQIKPPGARRASQIEPVHDALKFHGTWPVYPGLQLPVDEPRSFDFDFPVPGTTNRVKYDLRSFVEESFKAYKKQNIKYEQINRFTSRPDLYNDLFEYVDTLETWYLGSRGSDTYESWLENVRAFSGDEDPEVFVTRSANGQLPARA